MPERHEHSHTPLPLEGIRVLEFTHMVMGPSCGLILADLGAEVIKIEPPQGEHTRSLLGSGAGFFPMYNRNKKSVCLDLKSPQGREAALRLIATADILVENFRPGVMKSLGLDYDSLARLNERLIYVSLKGFLPGPYEHRTALDEVVQMMGGLAYMTGRKGDPLRAGASINDVMGGMFGALAAIAALRTRDTTGKGQEIQSALFENNAFLVGQHILQYAVTGKPANPMPERISAWGIYDIFTTKDEQSLFLGVVSDSQWKLFCQAFGYTDWLTDENLATNSQRVLARPGLMDELRSRLKQLDAHTIMDLFERNNLPFAPIAKPEDLLEDEHMLATGGIAPMELLDGTETKTVLLPILMNGERLEVRSNPPQTGEHTETILRSLGYTDQDIAGLSRDRNRDPKPGSDPS